MIGKCPSNPDLLVSQLKYPCVNFHFGIRIRNGFGESLEKDLEL
jgi:hypothetical protein